MMKRAALLALPLMFVSQMAFASLENGTYDLKDDWGNKNGKSYGIVNFATYGGGGYYSVSHKQASAILQLADAEATISGKVLNIHTNRLVDFSFTAKHLTRSGNTAASSKVTGSFGSQALNCNVRSVKGDCQFKLTKTGDKDLDVWVWAGNNPNLRILDIDAKLDGTRQPTPVSAPSSMLLLGTGLAAMFGFGHVRRTRAAAKKA